MQLTNTNIFELILFFVVLFVGLILLYKAHQKGVKMKIMYEGEALERIENDLTEIKDEIDEYTVYKYTKVIFYKRKLEHSDIDLLKEDIKKNCAKPDGQGVKYLPAVYSIKINKKSKIIYYALDDNNFDFEKINNDTLLNDISQKSPRSSIDKIYENYTNTFDIKSIKPRYRFALIFLIAGLIEVFFGYINGLEYTTDCESYRVLTFECKADKVNPYYPIGLKGGYLTIITSAGLLLYFLLNHIINVFSRIFHRPVFAYSVISISVLFIPFLIIIGISPPHLAKYYELTDVSLGFLYLIYFIIMLFIIFIYISDIRRALKDASV